MNRLTVERLRALFSYDPATGIFTRLVSRQGFNANTAAGTLHKSSGYVYVGVDRKKYRSHRLAWMYMTGEWPSEVDHINGVRADNRWANLRECTRTQNNANGKRRRDNTSGYKCVSLDKRHKSRPWRAYIVINGKQKHLGRHDSIEKAAAAYAAAAHDNFGEFSRT